MALLLLAAGVPHGAACFSPRFETCAVECGEGDACPPGTSCLADGVCHESRDEPLCSLPAIDGSLNDPFDGAVTVMFDADPLAPDAGPPVTPENEGDLVISEIFNDSSYFPEEAHEWFEIYNPTGQRFDLEGLGVKDDLGDPAFTITASVIVEPGGRVVLARNDDTDVNGGVVADFDYPDTYNLGNSGDVVEIYHPFGPVTLDRVAYGTGPAGWPNDAGSSKSLDPDEHTHTANDLPASWCDATSKFNDLDSGTPGAANSQCPR